MKFFLMCFVLFLQLSCTRLQTLNLKPHFYSQGPSQIIWIQLAGFTDQHLPLLRFDNPDVEYHTSFETSDCVGKMWNFNLFELRPEASSSFLSQLTGSKNIKNLCEDAARKPLWSYLSDEKYITSILENGANDEETLEKILSCGESRNFGIKTVEMVRMGPEQKSGVGSFHYQDQQNITNGLYYDKSCQKGLCFSSFSNNAKKLMANIGTNNTRNFYLLRDFSYLKALRKKDLSHAKEILQDLDKLLIWIDAQKRADVLVIISGAEGVELDFPKEGKEWAEFERLGKNLNLRNSSLMSTVFAKVPMAENFCGLFEESEIIKRILSKPSGKKFSWDVLNPINY